MNGNKDAVSVLAPLFRGNQERTPLLLLGAGASFRSGVPTAAESVRQIARRVFSERQLQGARPPERVKPSEWEPWLQGFPWFVHGADRLAENFPLIVDHLLRPAEYRKEVLLDLMQPRAGISVGYKVIADFVMRGLVNTVLTTNFDACLPDALRGRQPHIREINEVNRIPGDTSQFDIFSRCQIVWLHGRADHYSDRNTSGEVGAADPALVSKLQPLLDASPIIVMGYRGAELSVMEGIFGQSGAGRLDFPRGIFWCLRHGDTPHPHVEALARRTGNNFTYVPIDGFDEVMTDLGHELAGTDRFSAPAIQRAASGFDEQIADEATLDDLDFDLAMSVMSDYCTKLKRAPLTREALPALMREQLLLVSQDGKDKVTAGALLLFGKSPQQFFPHAVIALTEAGKKRELYEGNLISQHRRLLERFDAEDINPLLKVKGRRVHEERRAYPPRVLVELLVNMLVHRDYAVEEPGTIDVHPGAEIIFSNPGGLPQRIAGKVAVETDGRFVPSENLTEQRNPALCDIFFGISAMERAGTGLMDVAQLMMEASGGSAFYHHGKSARFDAYVSPPLSSAGSSSVARPNVPIGVYVLNALPFVVLPAEVSIIKLKVPWSERPRNLDTSECGTFLIRGTELWGFTPLPILTTLLASIVDSKASRSKTREEVEASPDDKRVLSWLLRKHWERHLLSFEKDGLVIEDKRKHRAFFHGLNGENRTIIWNGPQRKGNKRDVAKKRGEGTRSWFENEGIGYDIVDIGGLWCVRIKPFYMFTGRNGRTPLPSFTRASKATSRMKFDRNKNVEADLAFWSSFLGRGAETINLGGPDGGDLLLAASFLTVEVPEIGLLSDDSEDQDRMSA
jgi:hypothetical protein